MVLDTSFTEIEVLKMDIAELTKQNYQSMIRIKELSEENARLQFQNGNYQYYDVSDFTDGHELIEVKEVEIDE